MKRFSIKSVKKVDSVYKRVDIYLEGILEPEEYEIYKTITSLKLEMAKEVEAGSTMKQAFDKVTGQL